MLTSKPSCRYQAALSIPAPESFPLTNPQLTCWGWLRMVVVHSGSPVLGEIRRLPQSGSPTRIFRVLPVGLTPFEFKRYMH